MRYLLTCLGSCALLVVIGLFAVLFATRTGFATGSEVSYFASRPRFVEVQMVISDNGCFFVVEAVNYSGNQVD